MNIDEAIAELQSKAHEDMVAAEDVIESFIKTTGLPPMEGLLVIEAAVAHMRMLGARMGRK